MNKQVTVVGLGASELDQLPLGIYRHLKATENIYTRTMDHPVVTELLEEGVIFQSFDDVYEKHDDFASVYEEIVQTLISIEEPVTYAVPGHPFVAEKTIQLLLEAAQKEKIELNFLGGQSFLDPMYTALQIDPIEGCQIIDGTSISEEQFSITNHLIIVQVYDAMIASDVKLTLMERLPDDYEVTIATAVGSKQEDLTTVPLYELDHVTTLNNLTAVYVPPVQDETLLYGEFSTLKEIIKTLRGPNGCPWDQKQTHQSLKKYLLEETYEVFEAIDREDDDHLIEELGDVLLQVMLHAQIGEDIGYFSIRDIIEQLTEKMIRRHPHVFAPDDEAKSWDEIKKDEGKEDQADSILATIPKGIPALMEAIQLQKKAAKVGFDWDEAAPIWMKLQEETAEFLTEIKAGNEETMKDEFGDILFVLANLARFYKIDAEEALIRTNQKFKRRFHYIEESAKKRNKQLTDFTLAELDQFWDEAKQHNL